MTNFWVVFNRREQSGKSTPPNQKFENATLGQVKGTAPASTGQLEDACVVRLVGGSLSTVLEAQQAVQHFYPGLQTGTPVVVEEVAFKES